MVVNADRRLKINLMKWVLPHNIIKWGNTVSTGFVWREKGLNSFKEELRRARLGRSEK